MRDQKQMSQIKATPHTPNLMASIPKMYQSKAAGLVQYLEDDRDVSWDEQGQLSIGEQKIDNSHIIDLIHDALRLRKKVARPQGWRELSAHLRKKNIPKELVGNPVWFTPPSSPSNTPTKARGVKRAAFKDFKTPAKKRVIGHKE